MVWYGHGMVRYGMIWLWYGMVWHGMVMVWYGMLWYGHGMVWYDMVVVWYGIASCLYVEAVPEVVYFFSSSNTKPSQSLF